MGLVGCIVEAADTDRGATDVGTVAVILVLDHSGSMSLPFGDGPSSRLDRVRAAVESRLAGDGAARFGLVIFNTGVPVS